MQAALQIILESGGGSGGGGGGGGDGQQVAGPVVAVLCGHDHKGGYHFESTTQVHHITLQSPLNRGADGSAFGLCSVFEDRFEIRGPVLSDLLPLETVERRLSRKQQEEAAHERRRRRRRRPSKKGQGSQSDRADRSSRAETAAGNVGGGWLPEVEVVESGAVSSGTGGLVEEEEVMRFMLPRAQT
eukprot:COSAG06_NODE_410_length_16089_cov_9.968793_7_plen_186_part_00